MLPRPECRIQLREQFFLFSVRNCFISPDIFNLLLDRGLWINILLRFGIHGRHHPRDAVGNRLVLRKVRESVPLGDHLVFFSVLRVSLIQKCCAEHFFCYGRHVLLSGDEPLDVLIVELNIRRHGLRGCLNRADDEMRIPEP